MNVDLLYQFIDDAFPKFGVNKRHAVVRLLSEISRRDKCDPLSILPEDLVKSKDFAQVKGFLASLRYPTLSDEEILSLPTLTEFNILSENAADVSTADRTPKKVFYEKSLANSALLKRLRKKLIDIPFEEIEQYSQYVKDHDFSIEEYNSRCDLLFVVKERYDFFLHCPCSKPSRPCGYHIMNAGMGCVFDCAYCYLQGYTNAPGIVVPGNLQEILEQFKVYYQPGMRLGTGQFTDSLAMDDLLEFSPVMIDFFRQFDDIQFELKTKSHCIENVLKTQPSRNIVISWSVNPQHIIERCEFFTASLEERLEAASQCAKAGYSVGFHFDPIVYYDGWESDYREVVKRIFNAVDPAAIGWISLGCLRMTQKVRRVMEQRFPDSPLLLAEHFLGFDGKLRYSRRIRRKIYHHMRSLIRTYSHDVVVYLCMEDEEMNRDLEIPFVQGCAR